MRDAPQAARFSAREGPTAKRYTWVGRAAIG